MLVLVSSVNKCEIYSLYRCHLIFFPILYLLDYELEMQNFQLKNTWDNASSIIRKFRFFKMVPLLPHKRQYTVVRITLKSIQVSGYPDLSFRRETRI